ncbi:hypothetical protein LCGC14_0223610 [marine sediment metagenome]|uniref:HNH nuclease domain-containing protein n=1 Tax=marine sediment metagenome TaxID=412755 RepID=A0A0F9XFY2_9ZZZZ
MAKLYHSKDYLINEYINNNKEIQEIARENGVCDSTISRRMDKLKIPKRGQKRENHPMWKGGKYTDMYGYVKIKNYNHPNVDSGNYIGEHTLIMEKSIGRYLKHYGRNNKNNELVHHINGIKNDNRIENLFLCNNMSHHKNIHYNLEKVALKLYMEGKIKFKEGDYKIGKIGL